MVVTTATIFSACPAVCTPLRMIILLPLRRYLFYDTWNLLDTLTLSTVSLAFLFRLLGTREFGGPVNPGDYFFAAQFFLALR